VLGVRALAARPQRRGKKASAQLRALDKKAYRSLKGHFQRFIARPGVAASRFCLALLALDASGVATTLDAAASTSELFEHFKQRASAPGGGGGSGQLQQAHSAVQRGFEHHLDAQQKRVFCAKLLAKARKGKKVLSFTDAERSVTGGLARACRHPLPQPGAHPRRG